MIEEVGEAHPGRQGIEVAELFRQVLRRHHQPLVHQLAQGTHVLQGGLAAEQQGDLLQLALAYRQLDVVVDQDEAPEIRQILGEGHAVRARAAEHAADVGVAVLVAQPLVAEELEDIQEISPLLGHVDGTGAIGQLAQAAGIGGEGDHLHEDRQSLLGHRGGRRPLGQKSANRLVLPVERGGHVDQPLVHLQSAHVALVEQRVAADLDVVGAGRGVGDDAVGLEHANRALVLAEHPVQALLKLLHGSAGIEGLGLVLEVAAIGDLVQVVGQHQAEIGQGRVAGVEGIRSGAVELLGNQPEIRGTARLEHADDHAVFLAHAPHDLPDRAELAELAGDIPLDALKLLLFRHRIEGQGATLVIAPVHRRQLATIGGEEALAHFVVPFHRVQHADRHLRLDQPVGKAADDLLVLVLLLASAHRALTGRRAGSAPLR